MSGRIAPLRRTTTGTHKTSHLLRHSIQELDLHPQTRNLILELQLHKCFLGAQCVGSGGRTRGRGHPALHGRLGLLLDSLHLLISLPCLILQRLDARVDAVASEFLVETILVHAQRRGRRTARRSQARLHRAAGYLAAFVKE